MSRTLLTAFLAAPEEEQRPKSASEQVERAGFGRGAGGSSIDESGVESEIVLGRDITDPGCRIRRVDKPHRSLVVTVLVRVERGAIEGVTLQVDHGAVEDSGGERQIDAGDHEILDSIIVVPGQLRGLIQHGACRSGPAPRVHIQLGGIANGFEKVEFKAGQLVGGRGRKCLRREEESVRVNGRPIGKGVDYRARVQPEAASDCKQNQFLVEHFRFYLRRQRACAGSRPGSKCVEVARGFVRPHESDI